MLDVNSIDKYLLLQGDCMERMKEISDNSIELILWRSSLPILNPLINQYPLM